MTFNSLGSYVGLAELQPIEVPAPFTFVMGQSMESYSGKCYADHVETPCTVVQAALRHGWGVQVPWDPYRSATTKQGQPVLAAFTVDWDNGFFGFVPVGARFGNSPGSWYDPASKTEGRLPKFTPSQGPVALPQIPHPRIPIVIPQPPIFVPGLTTCGVNPITATPGFTGQPQGSPGHYGLGTSGRPGFNDPRRTNAGVRYNHGTLDIAAIPGSSIVVANRAGTVITSICKTHQDVGSVHQRLKLAGLRYFQSRHLGVALL